MDPINRTTIMRPLAPRLDGNVVLAGAERESGDVLNPEPPRTPSGRPLALAARTQSGASDAEPVVTREFGGYEILSEISRGSFGVVYKARQQGLDRVVALKVLLAGVHASAEAVARFQREAKAVARLKHPNIVPVYDIGTHDGHHYFGMEFIEGHALSTLITNHGVTPTDALATAEALSDALETAHHAGVIHRDIKPSNILVDTRGKPHITDFGLAKQIDLDTKYTLSGTTLGTPAYMPPEQARGEIAKIDARSDVYAIGAVLYEMLTGQTPFAGRSLLEVVVAVINEPVRPPRQINPKIHHDVQTIVLKCLEKDPRLRYASAAELRDDLRRFRSGEAIRAKPASLLRRSGRFVHQNGMVLGAASVVLFIAGFSYYRVKKEQQDKLMAISQLGQEIHKEELKKQAVWRPDWWFPPKSPEMMNTPELREIYKIPDDRKHSFTGLFPGRDTVWDFQDEHTVELPGNRILVSSEDSRFYGDRDLEAILDFRLTEKGAEQGVRIGIQTIATDKGYDGIPYMLEIKSGAMRLIGPQDLFAYTNPRENDLHRSNEKRPPPKLDVKAEKTAPKLETADYQLSIHREGTLLRFTLSIPGSSWNPISLAIKDANLSNWIFKNTQLAVRAPAAGEFKALSAVVSRKYGGEEVKALSYFQTGDYNVAEIELNRVLVEGKDHFEKALAMYQLGLIHEISHVGNGRELGFYSDALSELEQIVREEANRTERNRLTKELHVRRMIFFARHNQWSPLIDELNLGLAIGQAIGEPLAWEMQGVLEHALKDPDKPEHPDKLNDADKIKGSEAALRLLLRMGLNPGSARLDRCARELALSLAAENRFNDLFTLHKAYPSNVLADGFFDSVRRAVKLGRIDDAVRILNYIAPYQHDAKEAQKVVDAACGILSTCMRTHKYADAAKLLDPKGQILISKGLLSVLCKEIELQAKDLSGDNFYDFSTSLLPVAAAQFPPNEPGSAEFGDALDKIVRAMIPSGRMMDIIKLHEALRGAQKSDPRLAASFAAAVSSLANIGDPGAKELSITLLKYCYAHVAPDHPEIRDAARLLGERLARVDDNRSYSVIHSIQQAYPAPQLLTLAGNIMYKLNQDNRYEETIIFFSQARVEFHTEGRVLTPYAVSALENIQSPDQRAQLLSSIWHTVDDQFKQENDEAAERFWRMDYGDIALGLNQWDRAREMYSSLFNAEIAEPELKAKAGLRLGVLAIVRSGTAAPVDFLVPLLSMEKVADEIKLAARLLAAPEQLHLSELDARLKELRAPLLLSDGEWALIRGLRLRMENMPGEATSAFEKALSQADASRTWPRSVASRLLSSSRSPDEEPKTLPADAVPAPRKDTALPKVKDGNAP